MTTVTRPIHFAIKGRYKRAIVGEEPAPTPEGRIPRVARLMALAIRFDKLLVDGVISDISELARLSHVTQPRMTQIMNLLHLAPDIQEEILFLPVTIDGRDPIHERMLRGLTLVQSWGVQRRLWRQLLGRGRVKA
ncbi:MAG: hypothetical protein HBSAPP03_23580 [Phycisphaerae bacterium]|nr:MAG: hypothetical protein HBSAPP03_23580 [Phycisphaerae bacterium]